MAWSCVFKPEDVNEMATYKHLVENYETQPEDFGWSMRLAKLERQKILFDLCWRAHTTPIIMEKIK